MNIDKTVIYAQLINGLDHDLVEYCIKVFDELIEYGLYMLPLARGVIETVGIDHSIKKVVDTTVSVYRLNYATYLGNSSTDDPKAEAMVAISKEIINQLER